MGWQATAVAVLNAGNTIINDQGIFSYESLPPTLGGLMSSDAIASGTDPAGNAYIGGGYASYFFSGGPTHYAVVMANGGIQFFHASSYSGPWVAGPAIAYDANETIEFNLGNVSMQGTLTAEGGTPTSPTQISTDSWNTATLMNGFVGSLQYKLMPDESVWLTGAVTCPATNFNFVNINTAPASIYGLYTGALAGQGAPLLAYNNNTGSSVLAKVFGNGQIQFINAAANDLIVINGTYPNQ